MKKHNKKTAIEVKLSQDDLDELDYLAEEWGCSRQKALVRAIHRACVSVEEWTNVYAFARPLSAPVTMPNGKIYLWAVEQFKADGGEWFGRDYRMTKAEAMDLADELTTLPNLKKEVRAVVRPSDQGDDTWVVDVFKPGEEVSGLSFTHLPLPDGRPLTEFKARAFLEDLEEVPECPACAEEKRLGLN